MTASENIFLWRDNGNTNVLKNDLDLIDGKILRLVHSST